jgi:hypothetical protein
MIFAGQANTTQLFPFQSHSLKTDYDSKNELRGTNYQIVKDPTFAANKNRQQIAKANATSGKCPPRQPAASTCSFQLGHVSYRLMMACQQATVNQKCFAIKDRTQLDLPAEDLRPAHQLAGNSQEAQIPSVTATCQRVTVSLATGVILPTAGTATRGKASFLCQLRRTITQSSYFGQFSLGN